MVTYMWLTPTRTGAFDVLCEELCGVGHFAMRRVVVDSPDAYRVARAADDADRGATGAGCGCGPGDVCDLHRVPWGKRRGQRDVERTEAGWTAPMVRCPAAAQFQARHPWRRARRDHRGADGAVASMLDDTAVANVAAHIATLPDDPPRATLQGDAERGSRTYVTCANCHGTEGQGVWSTKSPRLANQSDWYLIRQLNNFRTGVRGRHPQDFDGAQMARIARILDDEQDGRRSRWPTSARRAASCTPASAWMLPRVAAGDRARRVTEHARR